MTKHNPPLNETVASNRDSQTTALRATERFFTGSSRLRLNQGQSGTEAPLGPGDLPVDGTQLDAAASRKVEDTDRGSRPPETASAPHSPKDNIGNSPTEKLVESYVQNWGLAIRFDGTLRSGDEKPRDLSARIAAEEADVEWLQDRILLDFDGSLKARAVKPALRRVIARGQRLRLASIAEPLFAPLTEEETVLAQAHWTRLALIFKGDPQLNIAKLQQFFWLVKRKVIGESVERHLMLIVVSTKQGVGKTQFVDKLVSPWQEAAAGPILITDVTDPRSADIFRYPIGKVDDMEKVPHDRIAVLKSVLTTGRMGRRKLGTMRNINLRQTLTLIGTANQAVHELIEDDTGHRRFATLEFDSVEGEESNDRIWSIVNGVDYELLWRSISTLSGAPIEAHLDALAAEQRRGSLETDLLHWLQTADVDGPEFLRIRTNRGVGAAGLYELFVTQTGSSMTQTAFGRQMRGYASREDVPIGGKIETSERNVYQIKPKKNGLEDA